MCKRVLVTGVARGIGRAIAERFLQEGYMLVGTYYTRDEQNRFSAGAEIGNRVKRGRSKRKRA